MNWLLLLGSLVATAAGAAAVAPGEITADGHCPDLSGTYREAGMTRDRGALRKGAHLSWMIGGGKEKGAKRALSNTPTPPDPIVYVVQAIRIRHPAPGRFSLEAFDENRETLGTFEFGPPDGWQCGEGVFFNYKKRQIGGEGTWSNEISVQKLRKSDGNLIRSIEVWNEKRSLLTLGLGTGAPDKVTDVEYSFEEIR